MLQTKRFLLFFVFIFSAPGFGFCQTWEWISSASVSGSTTYAYGMSKDTKGNIFVGGMFANTPVFGGIQVSSAGTNDAFIAKIDSSGNWLWIRTAGYSTKLSILYAIASDSHDNVYITGIFNDTITLGPFTLTEYGMYPSAFVAKLDSAGNWIWASKIEATIQAIPASIVTDASGNCYVGGRFNGTAMAGGFLFSSNGSGDLMIVKFDSTGNCINYTSAGDAANDQISDMSADSSGNLFVTGEFKGQVYFDTLSLKNTGNQNVFTARLDSSLAWIWVKQFGGKYDDQAHCVAYDGDTTLYFSGHFLDTAYFAADTLINTGAADTYIIKSDLAGNSIWLKQFGIFPYSEIRDISVKPDKNLFGVGTYYDSVYFDSIKLANAIPNFHLFAAELSSNANWTWACGSVNSYQFNNGQYATADARACIAGTAWEVYFSGTGARGIVFGIDTIPLYSFLFVAKINPTATGFSSNAFRENEMSVYPNPFSSGLVIQNSGFPKKSRIKIIDSMGNMVFYDENFFDTVKLPHLKNGIYFVQLCSDDGHIFSKKIVKQ